MKRCAICTWSYTTDEEGEEHMLRVHPATFVRKPLVTGVQSAIATGITSTEPAKEPEPKPEPAKEPEPEKEPEVVAAPGTYWGFTRR